MSMSVCVIVTDPGLTQERISQVCSNLKEQSKRPDEVIFISSDPSFASEMYFGDMPFCVSFLHSEDSEIAESCLRNLAAKHSSSSHLLFLSSQITLSPYYIEYLVVPYLLEDDNSSLVVYGTCFVGRLKYIETKSKNAFYRNAGKRQRYSFVPFEELYFSGSNFCITKVLFEAVGGYDEKVPGVFSDYDLHLRISEYPDTERYISDGSLAYRDKEDGELTNIDKHLFDGLVYLHEKFRQYRVEHDIARFMYILSDSVQDSRLRVKNFSCFNAFLDIVLSGRSEPSFLPSQEVLKEGNSVIILFHGKIDVLRDNFRVFLRSPRKDFEVIVLDDTESDEVKELASNWSFGRYIRVKTTEPSVSQIRNIGMKAAKYNTLSLLDGDVLVTYSFLDEVNRFFSSHKNSVMQFFYRDVPSVQELHSPWISSSLNGNVFERYVKSHMDDYVEADPLYFFSYNINIQVSGDLRCPLFDERYAGWGAEDIDYSLTLQKEGYSFFQSSLSPVFHVDDYVRLLDTIELDDLAYIRMFKRYSLRSSYLLYLKWGFEVRWQHNRFLRAVQVRDSFKDMTVQAFFDEVKEQIIS